MNWNKLKLKWIEINWNWNELKWIEMNWYGTSHCCLNFLESTYVRKKSFFHKKKLSFYNKKIKK